MAKKSRKKRRQDRKPNVPRYEVPVESADESAPEDVVQAAAPVTAPAPKVAHSKVTAKDTIDTVNWAAEYPYVMTDLRRLAIVAALMLVLLLALNFILA